MGGGVGRLIRGCDEFKNVPVRHDNMHTLFLYLSSICCYARVAVVLWGDNRRNKAKGDDCCLTCSPNSMKIRFTIRFSRSSHQRDIKIYHQADLNSNGNCSCVRVRNQTMKDQAIAMLRCRRVK